jgi:glycosyltransferase involved in cell wall biosynthesis
MGRPAATPSTRAAACGVPLHLIFDAPLRTATAPDIALDTIAMLRRAGIVASLTFVKHDDDNEVSLRDLRARAAALKIEDHVRFEATAADAQGADALLVLHRWAGETLDAALRAMRGGVAIVAYPQGGARRFFDEHPFAARAKSCSGRDVAAAVTALAADELTRRRHIKGAREYVGRERNGHQPQ